MRRAQILSATVFILATSGTTWGQSGVCSGPMKQPHPHPNGSFNFETNSMHDDVGKLPDVISPGQFKYGIVSCVSNPDPNYPLYVRWLIPGPEGWVQPLSKLNSVPRLTNENKASQLEGCLQYGNRGDTTRAYFSGLKADKPRVEDERRRNCREAAAMSPDQSGGAIEKIILRIKNFFPSDAKRPRETMLQLEGQAGIESKGPNQYSSSLSYVITQIGKEGSPKNIFVQPVFPGQTEALFSAFYKNNPSVVRLDEKGTIAFDVVNVTNPQLAYASYEIFDQNKAPVAKITIPVFISSEKR